MNTSKITQARIETENLLNAALRHSTDFQKPAQIEFYRAHIAHLDRLVNREPSVAPTADLANWDVCACVLAARAA
jgi:hypothetical protein